MQIKHMTGNVPNHLSRGLGIALISCALLAACESTQEKAVSDPDHLTVTVAGGKLMGQYNPAGFDAQIVRQSLAANCIGGQVATYEEAAGVDGLVAFTATCVQGTTQDSGTFTYRRLSTAPAPAATVAAGEGGGGSGY